MLVLVTLVLAHAALAAPYTLADLEALAKDGAWDELLSHATDVGPAARNDRWKELVEKAAVARLADITDDELKWSPIESTEAAVQNLVRSFPSLKASKTFDHGKNLAMVRALKVCLWEPSCRQTDRDWLRRVYQVVKSAEHDKEAACAAGQMVMTRMVSYTALSSFEIAVSGGPSSPCCKTKELQTAVSEGLDEADYQESATGVAKTCGLALKEPAKKKKKKK
jgi:hypothetical protein